MIYRLPAVDEPLDQGDIIDQCPVVRVTDFDLDQPNDKIHLETVSNRVIILTQTCDLANEKVTSITTAVVHDAQKLVDNRILKPSDIRGPIRACRVWGWYFLPKNAALSLPESIIDLRQLHTMRLDLLVALCRRGQRRARLQPLYREHLGKHLADTYSRIGLPQPYDTD